MDVFPSKANKPSKEELKEFKSYIEELSVDQIQTIVNRAVINFYHPKYFEAILRTKKVNIHIHQLFKMNNVFSAVNINYSNVDRRQQLFLETLKQVFVFGADANQPDSYGFTPLHLIIKYVYTNRVDYSFHEKVFCNDFVLDVVKYLFDMGANPNYKTNMLTPFQYFLMKDGVQDFVSFPINKPLTNKLLPLFLQYGANLFDANINCLDLGLACKNKVVNQEMAIYSCVYDMLHNVRHIPIEIISKGILPFL